MSRFRSQNQKKFQFKSAGELTSDVSKYKIDTFYEKLIGIKTPMELGSGRDGMFRMNRSLKDQVKDNFKNMLMTNHGERLGNHNFGANLEELAFELASEDMEQEVLSRINQAISRHMPYIVLNNFNAFTETFDNEHTAKVGIRVAYSIPRLNVSNEIIEVIIRAVG